MVDLWIENCKFSDTNLSMDKIYGRKFWKKVLMGFISYPEIDEFLDMGSVGGILFIGKEGAGKTSLINAFLGELSKQEYFILNVKGRSLLNPEEELNIKMERLVDECVNCVEDKVVVVLEDMDFLEDMENFSFYIAEKMSFLETKKNHLIWILSALDEEHIPSVLRDEMILCPVLCPNDEDRKEYLKDMIGDYIYSENNFNIDTIVDMTDGFTFAELTWLVVFIRAEIKSILVEKYNPDFSDISITLENIFIGEKYFKEVVEYIKYKLKDNQVDKNNFDIPLVFQQMGYHQQSNPAQNTGEYNKNDTIDSSEDLKADNLSVEEILNLGV